MEGNGLPFLSFTSNTIDRRFMMSNKPIPVINIIRAEQFEKDQSSTHGRSPTPYPHGNPERDWQGEPNDGGLDNEKLRDGKLDGEDLDNEHSTTNIRQ